MSNNEKNLLQKKVNKNYYLVFLGLVVFVFVMSLNIGGVFGEEASDIIEFVDGTDYSSAWLEFVRERVVINGDETRSQLWDKIQQDNDKINLIRDLFTKDIYTGISGEGEEANLLFKELTLEQRKEVIKLITREDNLPIKGLDSEDLTLEAIGENLVLKHKNGAYVDLDALPDLEKGIDSETTTETFVEKKGSPGKHSLKLKQQSVNYKLKSLEYTDNGIVYTYETTMGKETGEVKITLQGIGTIKANGEYTNPKIIENRNLFSKINLLAGNQGQITITQNGIINLDNGAVIKYGEHSIKQMMSVTNRDKKAGYQHYVPNNDKLEALAKQGKSDETGVVDIFQLGLGPSHSPRNDIITPKLQNIILDSKQGRFFFSRKEKITFIDKDVFSYPTNGPYIQIVSDENGIILNGNSDNYIGFIANSGQHINRINVKNSKGERQFYGKDKDKAVYTYGAFYFRNGDVLQKTYQDKTSTWRKPNAKAAATVGKIEEVNGKYRLVEQGHVLGNNKYQITEINNGETIVYEVTTDSNNYILEKRVVKATAIPQGEATRRIESLSKRVVERYKTEVVEQAKQQAEKDPEINSEDIKPDETTPDSVRIIQTSTEPESTTTKGIGSETTTETETEQETETPVETPTKPEVEPETTPETKPTPRIPEGNPFAWRRWSFPTRPRLRFRRV